MFVFHNPSECFAGVKEKNIYVINRLFIRKLILLILNSNFRPKLLAFVDVLILSEYFDREKNLNETDTVT